jgi:hypothetical protein
MTARILDVTPDEYHALTNSFRVSMAKVLIEKSPMHAKAAIAKRDTKEMDFGSIAHRLVLGKGKDYEVLNFKDWRTDASKAARDRVRKEGKVPVLPDMFERANCVAEAIRADLADREIYFNGASELAVEWSETTPHGEVVCRAMFDHAWLFTGTILDLKITGDAAPASVERTAENLGYAIQAAAYSRALAALRPHLAGRVRFLFAFCESDEPYAINVCEPDGVFLELGERRWMNAVTTWAKCNAENHWPGYGRAINTIFPPPWALAREGYTTDER